MIEIQFYRTAAGACPVEEFLDELNEISAEIATDPARFAFSGERDIRETQARRFPYVVYYRILSDRVRILAVWHTARDASG